MSKMILPMASMPAAISESVALVLAAHGLSLSPELLKEIGNNSTQSLFALDESLDYPEQPSTADLLVVGQTLRAHAALGRPNPDTAATLGRVGEWMTDLANETTKKGSKAA